MCHRAVSTVQSPGEGPASDDDGPPDSSWHSLSRGWICPISASVSRWFLCFGILSSWHLLTLVSSACVSVSQVLSSFGASRIQCHKLNDYYSFLCHNHGVFTSEIKIMVTSGLGVLPKRTLLWFSWLLELSGIFGNPGPMPNTCLCASFEGHSPPFFSSVSSRPPAWFPIAVTNTTMKINLEYRKVHWARAISSQSIIQGSQGRGSSGKWSKHMLLSNSILVHSHPAFW